MNKKKLERPIPLPNYVQSAIQTLEGAGYLAYLAGGSVRDFLLFHPSQDYDLATNATPDQICQLFPQAIEVGKAYGVIKIPTGHWKSPILEIATFRRDQAYLDCRHPKGVIFSTLEEDAQRRDFTVNALFYDPQAIEILDGVGGLTDLKAKRIRAIGIASDRFQEDALRLLRAIRFQSQLHFELEPSTSAAIRAHAQLISKVSAERIREELHKMWLTSDPAQALSLLLESRLLNYLLPEVEACTCIQRLRYAKLHQYICSTSLVWAILFFDTHPIFSIEKIEPFFDRFKLARAERQRIKYLIINQSKFKETLKMSEAELQRFIRAPYFSECLALQHIVAGTSDGPLEYYQFCSNQYRALLKKNDLSIKKLITGKDLIALGLKPGPEFSKLLRLIEDLTLEKKITSKSQALEYVSKQVYLSNKSSLKRPHS